MLMLPLLHKELDTKLSKKGFFGQCNVIYLLKPFYNTLAV